MQLATLAQNKNNNSEIKIIEENQDGLIIEFHLGDYYFDEVETSLGYAKVLKSAGCSNNYVNGTPDLPAFHKAIKIPSKGSVSCEVLAANYSSIENILIAPSRGSIMRNVDPASVPYEYGKEYLINNFLPENRAIIGEPYIIHKLRGSNLTILPFSYNPVSRELRIFSEIIIKIKFNENEKSVNELNFDVKNVKIDEEFRKVYSRHFVNYSNNIKYTPLEEGTPGKMLIIAADNYAPAMAPYIQWKREKGIETELVLKSQVGTSSTQIKSFIQNYYSTKDLTYVLLVGDGTDIPPMTISGNDSDNGYTYLAGSDGYADIFIGRFSGNSVADIITQVNKTIYYERDMSSDANWLENAFGSASNEGGGSAGHNGGESDLVHLNLIKTKLQNYGYTVTHVNQDGGSNAQITAAFNSGIGVANYIGHGDVTMWVNTSFTNTQVNALANDFKLPFVFSVACVNGDFKNNTCFAEAWLRATHNGAPSGAVGFLGSTINQSWNEPMTGQDEMNDILVESYQNNIKRTYGGICFNGMFKMIEEGGQGQAMADTWTIFGDPSLMVRTKTPQEMTISHQSTLMVGASEFLVNCDVEGALVSLTKQGDNETIIIGTGYVLGGIATIEIIPFQAPGTMKVTVTAFNKITYQEDVLVIVPDGPYIVNGGYLINDEFGNNNQNADYNEIIYLTQTLTNVGVADANMVSASISTTSSNIQILNSNADFGIITAGNSSTIFNAFQLSINDGVADQTIVPISLTISDEANHQWNTSYNLILNAPLLSIAYANINDSQGNNNGMIDAGETIILNLNVFNNGHAVSPEGILNAICSNSNVSFISSSTSVSEISQGSSQTLSIEFIVDESTPVGENLCFEFYLTAGYYGAQLGTCLPCGLQIEDFETGDFSKYQWQNNSNIPWLIVSDAVYEGNYAAKSGNVPSSGGESQLIIVLDVQNNDEISFYRKVSCEAPSSWWGQLTYWDYLSFSIDNQEKAKWAGEVNWSLVSYPVSSGNHTFKWLYKKDNYLDQGSDCAWIDYIKLPTHTNSITYITNSLPVHENSMSIYPNPGADMVYIALELVKNINATISIFSVDGRVVYESPANLSFVSGQNIIVINTSDFKSGLYFVKVESELQSFTKSLIINK